MPQLHSMPLLLLIRLNALHAWRRLLSVRKQSRLLSTLIFLFVVGYLGLSFTLFKLGLEFISKFPGLGILLTERLLFLLFAFLFALLLLSNLVISYTNLFRNRETHFLLTLPLSAQTVFQWKFIESTILASWAFIFLISPLLAAYGLTHQVAWHFYLVTFAALGLFIMLPGIAGAWIAVNLARFLDRRTFQVLAVIFGTAALIGAFHWLKQEPVSDEVVERRVLAILDRLLVKTNFAHFGLLPSYWLSQSVLQWAEGALRTATFFILVLLSNVLFFGYLTFNCLGKWFYEAFTIAHSRESVFSRWKWFHGVRERRKNFSYAQSWAERILPRFFGLTPDVQALIIKDGRMFWRDTTQWAQTFVLFGLLGVYIINLRHFSHQMTNAFWLYLVSYLNLGACSLNLATMTTRFVYPQFSLEGRRLWIVGMAPLGLERIVKTKFWLGSMASLVPSLGLISLSCYMLNMPVERTLFFAAAVTIMAFTLNALATGLGTLYPNFKEDNPSKIVSGFGGTFCLVLSFLYIVGSVILLAIGSPWGGRGYHSTTAVFASWIGFVVFSFLLGHIPFQLGMRRIAKFEM